MPAFRRTNLRRVILFLNSDLAGLPVVTRQGKETIAVPLEDTVTADPRRDFMGVLLSAISLR